MIRPYLFKFMGLFLILTSLSTYGCRVSVVEESQPSAPSGSNLVSTRSFVVSSINSLEANQAGFIVDPNGVENPKITRDGRFVVFPAGTTNFPKGLTNGVTGIYLKDLTQLASAPVLVSSLDSTLSDQSAVGAEAYSSDISGNGQYVVFTSMDAKLVPGGLPTQIFRKDMTTPQLPPVLVSSLDSTEADQTAFAGNNSSYAPAISYDGRFILFASEATNWVTNSTGRQIYLKDMNSPELPPQLVSSLDFSQADQAAFQAANGCHDIVKITSDAHYAFFGCDAPNFGTNHSGSQIYRKDLSDPDSVPLIISSLDSTAPDQAGLLGNDYSEWMGISPDGRFIAWETRSSNFFSAGPQNGDDPPGYYTQVWYKDLNTLTSPPLMVSSRNSSLANQSAVGGNKNSYEPQITDDGRYVFFHTRSTNLVSGTFPVDEWGDPYSQIYRKDMTQPTVPPLLVSSLDPLAADQTLSCSNKGANGAQTTSTGRYVVFKLEGTNLFSGANGVSQIYLKDLGDI